MAPPPPIILFAHGAGAPSASGWMRGWARRLGALGEVVTFDYPYMQAGRKAPDRMPVLLAAHGAALDEARARLGRDRPVVLAGKSMGGRVGCHLAVERAAAGDPPAAVVCFGYPLRAGGSGALRDEVLRALSTPILFVQGSRDALCPLADLEAVRATMTVPAALHVVEGGNHSLETGAGRRRSGANAPPAQPSDEAALAAVRAFLVARGLIS
jgi:predicted alpha/beta-hydrolase family hydrolase